MDDNMIVVAGEALVDLVPGDGGMLAAHLGGGPFNAARAVARLGGRAAYLGRVSGDRFGRALRCALQDDGVELGLVVETDDPTTLALAEVDAGGHARYRFYIDGTSVPGLRSVPSVDAVARASTLVVGTLGLVFDPTASTLTGLVAGAPAEQLVACDPNVRPAAIEAAGDAAAYRARLGRVLARADLVKVSDDDLAWLVPGVGHEAAARSLLRPGAVALVTVGARGALIVRDQGKAMAVPAVPVDVVDTIGAGDAFLGGFLAWWQAHGLGRADVADDGAVRAATHAAVAAAARAVSVAGASWGSP
jgi:fructokinase